ncbi:hypothetical protein REPUB_Repub15cG0024800 [Reevesia pubescens]
MDCVTLDCKSFNKGCMQVITTFQSKIDDFVSLQVGNYSFNVKVVEINHDCEFMGPCCYEELNFALRKVGLTKKDLQESEEEEDDIGEEDVQAKKTHEEDQSRKENWAIVPVNEDMHEITCMGTSSLVCVSRQGINCDLKSIDAEDGVTANRVSKEIIGVNLTAVNLENSEGNIRDLVNAGTDSGLQKNFLDHDQGGKKLQAKDMGSGPGEIDKPNDSFDAESEHCMGLDKADCGPTGLELTVRAAEDVNLMGLGFYVSNSHEDGDNTTGSNDEWEEEVDMNRVDNYNYSKKWRWVENINEELIRKNNKKGRKSMKKFDRRVYSCRNLAKVGSIANQSLSDGDLRQRKKVLAAEDEDEVNSLNAVDIWNFGKKLGFSADGNDQMVLRKLNDRIRVVNKKKAWGFSRDGKQDRVRSLINRVNPDMVLLQETKLKKCDNLLISKLWPFDEIVWLFCTAEGKKKLWEDLLKWKIEVGGLWCIAGDFNTVRNVSERRGCVYEGAGIQDFNNFTPVVAHSGFSRSSLLEKWNTGSWELPPPGSLKFNIDRASRGKPGPARIGGVLRENKGTVKMIFSKSIGVADSNLAELLDLREAIVLFATSRWVTSHGLRLESDNKNAVNWILSPASTPWRMKKYTVQIEALKKDLICWDISYVQKEFNDLADGFAKSGVEREADLLISF